MFLGILFLRLFPLRWTPTTQSVQLANIEFVLAVGNYVTMLVRIVYLFCILFMAECDAADTDQLKTEERKTGARL